MRVGVTLPMSESDGPGRMPRWTEVLAVAQQAEAAGVDSVWLCDHLISEPPGEPPEGLLEAWTILSALAATTRKVTLGTLVTCTSFRHPALLAKMAATADEISGGRLVLGLGAGTAGLEHRMYGFPQGDRIARFADVLEIVAGLLRGGVVTRNELTGARLMPPPQRRIPLLVAARGPRMMQLTARHAQAWNTAWYAAPDERLRTQLDRMTRALAEAGRPRTDLHVTVGIEMAGVDHLDAYARLGVDEVIVSLGPRPAESLARLSSRPAPPGR